MADSGVPTESVTDTRDTEALAAETEAQGTETEAQGTETEARSCETAGQGTNQSLSRWPSVAETPFALLSRWLVIGSIIVIGLILILHIIALGIFLFSGNYSKEAVEATLLSSGLSIIGVALAVWAGLNISNAVNAAHLLALQNDTHVLQDTISSIQHSTDTLTKRAAALTAKSESLALSFGNSTKEIFHRMFLNEISCAWRDLPLQDLLFSLKQTEDVPYDQLIKIELMYSQCSLRHKSQYFYDATLISTAQQAIREIEEIRDSIASSAVKAYLEYRKHSFLFYMGYCDESFEKSAKDFLEVEESYPQLTQSFFVADVRISSESRCYLMNRVGEAKSKIVHYHLCVGGGKSPELVELANSAVLDCENAYKDLHFVTDGTLKSTFCRDYGCALERRERLTGKDDHEEIIKAYEQALFFLVNDISGDLAARKNAYYVLLSYYKKYVDKNLMYRETDGKKYIDIEATIETLKKAGAFRDSFPDIVNKMAHIAKIARSDFPIVSSMHAYYGFSCAYHAVLALKDENPETASKYVNEIETVTMNMKILGITDPFYKQLIQWKDLINNAMGGAKDDVSTVSI